MSKARIVKPTEINPQTGKKKSNFDKSNFFKELGAGLKTLINNEQCLNQAENKKWYVAVIVCFFALLLSIVPMTVQTATANGSQFLNTTTLYNFDEGFYSFLEEAKLYNYDIEFDKESGKAKPVNFLVESGYRDLYTHYSYDYDVTNEKWENSTYIDFQVFYSTSEAFESTLLNCESEAVNSIQGRDASFIIFSEDAFAVYLYKKGNYTSVGGVRGDYLSLEKSVKLKDFFVDNLSTRLENEKASLDLFKSFIDNGYKNLRKTFTVVQALMLLGVNAGATLLMGLVIFLMTRGKNNPNRGMKFQTAFNISYWCSTGPAVLALVGGFIFKNSTLMIYVMLFGFRVMWLSMKSLSPVQG